MVKVVFKYIITLSALLASFNSFALPIDWHGVFGVDTTLIDNFRFIKKATQSGTIKDGSQEIELATGEHANASFQSYVFRLMPEMIINDAATIKAEITNGYGRGGFLGEDSITKSGTNKFGNALYFQNQSTGSNAVVINKVYAELYSDTATYIIGRHTADWGLGAVVNSGDGIWDRHSYSRDGITAKLKIGNFHLAPYWAKVNSATSLTRASEISETGISLLYDNREKEMSFGILYGVKESAAFESSMTGVDGTTALGKTNVKITDLYFRKKLGDFDFALEVPFMSGELGHVYDSSNIAKYKAKAFLLESNYQFTDRLVLGLNAGQVSGDDGDQSNFSAMYLNPNYRIAKLLFNYNREAIKDRNQSIYDSYITNATFFKLNLLLKTDRVDWNFALIKALAVETAAGSNTLAFNHTKNKAFTSTEVQKDDMGLELDVSFDYHWNKEITIGGSAGYLLTGDYWAYTDDSTNVTEPNNAFALQLNTSIEF